MRGWTPFTFALYVDDLFIVGMKLINIESVKKGLCAEFKMKDLGEVKFLLGIEIKRQENGTRAVCS